ncbi:hypothetical protein ACN94_20890 [Gordonia paraffinivorans]|nr:hypothetical protein [Gordonia paraffinivorans]
MRSGRWRHHRRPDQRRRRHRSVLRCDVTIQEVQPVPDIEELAYHLAAEKIRSVIGRYCVACDERDRDALRTCFADDATARYDRDADLAGAGDIVGWILRATEHLCWQQHTAQLMTLSVEGDQASAVAYLTSHQVAHDNLSNLLMMNSRYDFRFTRTGGRWKICRLELTVGTVETRAAQLGELIKERTSTGEKR